MDLEEIRDNYNIPDSQKRMWLETALSPNKDMTTAITNSQNNQVMVQIYLDQYIPAGSSRPERIDDLPFDKYFVFLLDHAKRIDETRNINAKNTRAVNKLEGDKPKSTTKPSTTTIEDSKIDYTVDRVPKETWDKMSDDQQRRFRKAKRDRNPPKNPTTPTTSTPNYRRQVHQAETMPDDSTVVTSTMTAEAPPNPPGSVLRHLLSNNASRSNTTVENDNQGEYIIVQNKLFRVVNATKVTYPIQNVDTTRVNNGALIDGGANGGMAGRDMRILETLRVLLTLKSRASRL